MGKLKAALTRLQAKRKEPGVPSTKMKNKTKSAPPIAPKLVMPYTLDDEILLVGEGIRSMTLQNTPSYITDCFVM